ncbi:MAG: hypothetical protein D6727_02155 [Gammaproteobacteria bacterium]|nr:MAG: hypothetical protein D6727_02155 [Gammaproteobacteria bacterium]
MSRFYTPRRRRNLYQPGDAKPFKLSRSKIDLFIECPRCFYIDRRLGTGRPPGFPFNLNSAVDRLLKAEFDIHRAAETTHPLLERYGVDARPVAHERLDDWRENFKGVQYLHEPTNLLITGAIDDLWMDSQGQYIVVDYKATSKNEPITALDQDWHSGYKRQMEVYQWLLRRNGYLVSDTGYFVYCNGRADAPAFDGKLEFDITLIPYTGRDDWVEPTLELIHRCLNDEQIPAPAPDCDYCAYVAAVAKVTGQAPPENSV